VAVRDSPGFYLETGVHMYFAARYSVMLGAVYRSAKIRDLLDRETRQPFRRPDGSTFSLDLSGFGARMALGIGL
jgi:hypothetical protein